MEGYGNENPGAFQPTRPLRGATTVCFRFLLRWRLFQPTRPLRGATNTRSPATSVRDFNPRAPCGARPLGPKEKALIILISTHAPLAGRDSRFSERTIQHYISTHAPLAGRDAGTAQECRELAVFQPTRPLRGATGTIFYIFPQVSGFQPTRPLRGATAGLMHRLSAFDISTHAPLAGRDDIYGTCHGRSRNFNPRAPCGARRLECSTPISSINFNPRAPCGARPAKKRWPPTSMTFQPTRPLRGATAKVYKSLCTFLR